VRGLRAGPRRISRFSVWITTVPILFEEQQKSRAAFRAVRMPAGPDSVDYTNAGLQGLPFTVKTYKLFKMRTTALLLY
jgi:hypothetical protein